MTGRLRERSERREERTSHAVAVGDVVGNGFIVALLAALPLLSSPALAQSSPGYVLLRSSVSVASGATASASFASKATVSANAVVGGTSSTASYILNTIAFVGVGAVCGNGITELGEQCDDGNTEPGDCCGSSCSFEAQGSLCSDDGEVCTDNLCDGAGACEAYSNSASCDDGVFCNGSDTCASLSCSLHSGDPCAPLDEGDASCSASCDEKTRSCSAPDPDGTACDNGDACTLGDTCSAGSCEAGAPVVCAASDQCHQTGTCDPASGLCSDPIKPDGSPCDDGLYCSGLDSCLAGQCSVHSGDPCPLASESDGDCSGSCDESTDSCDAADPDGTACVDSDLCFGPDLCASGICVGGTEPACDDGNLCTLDACDAQSGACSFTAQPTPDRIADPVAGCLIADTSDIVLHDSTEDRADKLRWKWVQHHASTNADAGAPDFDTRYDVCLFDGSAGAYSLVARIAVPADADRWENTRQGVWAYTDRQAASDGVMSLRVISGVRGKAKATLKAGRDTLPLPAPADPSRPGAFFDMDPTVIVQLHNSQGTCWTAAFDTALTNSSRKFKTKKKLHIIVP